MDLSAQYQQQQQQMASQTDNPSQPNIAYDQATLTCSSDHSQYTQYPYYNYTQYYSYADQRHQQSQPEFTSVHQPGVPVPPQAGSEQWFDQTHVQNQQNPHYQLGVFGDQQMQPQQLGASDSVVAAAGTAVGVQRLQWQQTNVVGPIGQSLYRGAGRRGRPFRRGDRSQFNPRRDGSGAPSFGRGRGWDGRHLYGSNENQVALNQRDVLQLQVETPESQMAPPYASGYEQTQGHLTPFWPPPHLAWCELCRVDCNTSQILKQHKEGKRHKKNLQVHEELQKLKQLVEGQNEPRVNSELKPKVSDQPETVEKSVGQDVLHVNLSPHAAISKDKVETVEQIVSKEAEPAEETARNRRIDEFDARGHGYKRKMRGGRGGKWIRTYEGSKRPVEPPKPRLVIPLICELCNVKCESPAVLESHLMGKKHIGNLMRCQGHQAMLGQAALQAALQVLYPSLQALCPPNANPSTSFAPQYHQPDVNGFLTLPGTSILPQCQTSVSETTSSSAPSLFEICGQKDSVHRDSESGGQNVNAVTEKTESPGQAAMVNNGAECASSTERQTEKGTEDCVKEEVNLPVNSSAVVQLERTD